jgi:hypothetical protein
VGGNAPDNGNGGNGGDGISYDLSGTLTGYAGGGGGGAKSGRTAGTATAGGGAGGVGTNGGFDAAANSGGGGGGAGTLGAASNSKGGNGGSGIVIVRYVTGGQEPVITTHPTNVTVTAGQTAAFSVTASGTPPLFYQWYTNSTPIGGATGTSYTTPATTTNDSGTQFKVIVTNAYGSVTSSVATLTVNTAPTGGVSATGGTVTNYTLNGTNYTAHIFTTVGTASINVTAGGNVEVLVVGGGGGGGQADNGPGGAGGGGGAGGLILTNFTVLFGSNYAITVGDGGSTNTAANGGNSLFGSLTALGGGYGGRMVNLLATNGGSGGGGFGRGALPTNAAGTATQPGSSSGGYGNNGGAGGAGTPLNGGGGGGGGGAGSAGAAGNVNTTGGNGGAGFTNSISGIETVYAGGGGGGSGESGYAAGSATGGGGAGGAYGTHGANASPNSGGGGGGSAVSSGAQFYGGKGGSGIVIVRYVTGGGVAPFEAWRQTYFTAEQLTNAAISSATADPDEDGLNNEQEYLAGTDPTNTASVLRISASEFCVPSSEFVIRWQSVSNKVYDVQATTNLLVAFTNVVTNLPATPTLNVHTDSVSGVGSRFYRVKAVPVE